MPSCCVPCQGCRAFGTLAAVTTKDMNISSKVNAENRMKEATKACLAILRSLDKRGNTITTKLVKRSLMGTDNFLKFSMSGSMIK